MAILCLLKRSGKREKVREKSVKSQGKGYVIEGLNWPPLELKTENCFPQISFDWFIRRMTEVSNFGIYLNFTVAMVTKMADKIGIK